MTSTPIPYPELPPTHPLELAIDMALGDSFDTPFEEILWPIYNAIETIVLDGLYGYGYTAWYHGMFDAPRSETEA